VAFLITGASRGFGRAIAKVVAAASQHHFSKFRIFLVARSDSGLQETKDLILAATSETAKLRVVCHALDLNDLDQLDANMDQLLQDLLLAENGETEEETYYDRVVLINNAGTIGHLGPCISSPSLQEMLSNVDLNITSCLWISVRFARYLKQQQHRATIVNISSLVAIADFPTFGIYSAGKAAREKYYTLLAKEEELDMLKTLNYAPGPLETDMVTDIRSASALDADLKPNFQTQLLDPEDSAKKLMRLLLINDFENGAHIEYYDLPDTEEEC
jgi:sepiapterin reductase